MLSIAALGLVTWIIVGLLAFIPILFLPRIFHEENIIIVRDLFIMAFLGPIVWIFIMIQIVVEGRFFSLVIWERKDKNKKKL